eukprot:gene22191-34056_t
MRAAALVVVCAAAVASQPNFVVVVVDDLRVADCAGAADTPALDAIRAGGVEFTRAYSAAPVPAATHGALLTGQTPSRTGLLERNATLNGRGGGSFFRGPDELTTGAIPGDAYTIATILQAKGYTTHHAGGYHGAADPGNANGFQRFFGGAAPANGLPGVTAVGGSFSAGFGALLNQYAGDYTQEYVDANVKPFSADGAGAAADGLVGTAKHVNDALADAAVATVRQSASKPFFLYLNPFTPAAGTGNTAQARSDLVAKYESQLGVSGGVVRAALVEQIDQGVGRIVAALKATVNPATGASLYDNTVVFVTSSNGAASTAAACPFSGARGQYAEAGLRIPLLAISGNPTLTAPSTTRTEPVTSVDLPATLAALTGVYTPPITAADGIDLGGLLQSRNSSAKFPAVADRLLTWHFPGYSGAAEAEQGPVSVAVQGDWKVVFDWESQAYRVYNLASDPAEAVELVEDGLAEEAKARVRVLVGRMWAQLRLEGAAMPAIRSTGDPVAIREYIDLDPSAWFANRTFDGQLTAAVPHATGGVSVRTGNDSLLEVGEFGLSSSDGAPLLLTFSETVYIHSVTYGDQSPAEGFTVSFHDGTNPFLPHAGFSTGGLSIDGSTMVFAPTSQSGTVSVPMNLFGEINIKVRSGTTLAFTSPSRAAGLLAMSLSTSGMPTGQPPNIVVIVADDIPRRAVGLRSPDGTPVMPLLSRWAAGEAAVFAAAHAAAASSAPARAALLTGQGSGATRVFAGGRLNTAGAQSQLVVDEAGARTGLLASTTTIAEVLRAAGYATASVGKFQVTESARAVVSDHGFDRNYGGSALGDPAAYFADGVAGFSDPTFAGGLDAWAGVYTQEYIDENIAPFTDAATGLLLGAPKHVADALADAAVAFLNASRARPAFVVLGHYGRGGRGRPDLAAKYAAAPVNDSAAAPGDAAWCELVDAAAARVVDFLEKTEDPRNRGAVLMENTVVVFTSATGGSAGVTPDNVGVPLLFKSGALTATRPAAGSTLNAPVSTVDLFRTLASIGGVNTSNASVAGEDLSPLLANPLAAVPTQRPMFWHVAAVTAEAQPVSAVLSGDLVLFLDYATLAFSLFNATADPGLSVDLVHPRMPFALHQQAKALASLLREWVAGEDMLLPTVRASGVTLSPPPGFDAPLVFDCAAPGSDGKAAAVLEADGVEIELKALGNQAVLNVTAEGLGVSTSAANDSGRVDGSAGEDLLVSFTSNVTVKSVVIDALQTSASRTANYSFEDFLGGRGENAWRFVRHGVTLTVGARAQQGRLVGYFGLDGEARSELGVISGAETASAEDKRIGRLQDGLFIVFDKDVVLSGIFLTNVTELTEVVHLTYISGANPFTAFNSFSDASKGISLSAMRMTLTPLSSNTPFTFSSLLPTPLTIPAHTRLVLHTESPIDGGVSLQRIDVVIPSEQVPRESFIITHVGGPNPFSESSGWKAGPLSLQGSILTYAPDNGEDVPLRLMFEYFGFKLQPRNGTRLALTAWPSVDGGIALKEIEITRVVPSFGPPNIIVILADDLSPSDLSSISFSGNASFPYAYTPSIDRLASDGVTFTRAYASGQSSAPSRAAFLTGKYPARHGWYTQGPLNVGGVETMLYGRPTGSGVIKAADVTIAEVLRASGYETAFIGDFEVGEDFEDLTEEHGFDRVYGGSMKGDSPPSRADTSLSPPAFGDFNGTLDAFAASYTAEYIDAVFLARSTTTHLSRLQNAPKHAIDAVSDATIQYLSDNRTKPAFLLVHPFAFRKVALERDHSRIDLHFKYALMGVPQEQTVHAALTEQLDQFVGRVVSFVDETEDPRNERHSLAENTVVIFASSSTSYLPQPETRAVSGAKGQLTEGGLRVPMAAYSANPKYVSKSTVVDTPVSVLDLYKTIADLAGAALPNTTALDGASLLPLMDGSVQSSDAYPHSLFWHYPGYHEVTGRAFEPAPPVSIAAAAEWKLVFDYETRRFSFFNVAEDPAEQQDLAAPGMTLAHEYLAATLACDLARFLGETRAELPLLRSSRRPVPAMDQFRVTHTLDFNQSALAGWRTRTVGDGPFSVNVVANGADGALLAVEGGGLGVASDQDEAGGGGLIDGDRAPVAESVSVIFNQPALVRSLVVGNLTTEGRTYGTIILSGTGSSGVVVNTGLSRVVMASEGDNSTLVTDAKGLGVVSGSDPSVGIDGDSGEAVSLQFANDVSLEGMLFTGLVPRTLVDVFVTKGINFFQEAGVQGFSNPNSGITITDTQLTFRVQDLNQYVNLDELLPARVVVPAGTALHIRSRSSGNVQIVSLNISVSTAGFRGERVVAVGTARATSYDGKPDFSVGGLEWNQTARTLEFSASGREGSPFELVPEAFGALLRVAAGTTFAVSAKGAREGGISLRKLHLDNGPPARPILGRALSVTVAGPRTSSVGILRAAEDLRVYVEIILAPATARLASVCRTGGACYPSCTWEGADGEASEEHTLVFDVAGDIPALHMMARMRANALFFLETLPKETALVSLAVDATVEPPFSSPDAAEPPVSGADDDDEGGLTAIQIVAIVVGSIFLLVLAAAAAYIFCAARKEPPPALKNAPDEVEEPVENSSPKN